MNRQQKAEIIEDLKKMMASAQATVLVNYKGLDVPLLQSLRKNLRKEGSQLRVTKATLMRIAAQDMAGSDGFSKEFKDQVGLVFVSKDISGTAKQLSTFAKENEALKIIAGFYESKLLTRQDLDILASLPSREVLIAQVVGTMQAPITNFVRVLHMMIARLAFVLKSIEEKKQAGQ